MRYTAQITDHRGNVLVKSDGHSTREEAARAVFAIRPNARNCSTGYGYNGNFDIRWHLRTKIMG